MNKDSKEKILSLISEGKSVYADSWDYFWNTYVINSIEKMEDIESTRYNFDWDCYSIKEYKWEDNLMIEKLEELISFHKKQILYWEDEIATLTSKI